ncbi:hypothetical protein [Burkholderia sp. S171]|uniref:hypothetical protein n=1 Tax=Burkholderia sp. S171 TaxID=1641860 RepID=UPI0020B111FA|nr:hypothetical protein [Burkholderia sp. S171]
MEPMKPMKPMKPMEPMKPMPATEKWWPDELGHASSSGSQNGVRYAFFPDKQRLLIEENGDRRAYDSGDHRINGVSQQQSHGHSLAFTSQAGVVNLAELKQVL